MITVLWFYSWEEGEFAYNLEHSEFEINVECLSRDVQLKKKTHQEQKWQLWACLAVQWLRICLPMQGHWFDLWSGKIQRAAGQLSLWAPTTEPVL